MEIKEEVLPFWVWLSGNSDNDALSVFLTTSLAIVLFGLVCGLLVAIFRYGPSRGVSNFGRTLYQAIPHWQFRGASAEFKTVDWQALPPIQRCNQFLTFFWSRFSFGDLLGLSIRRVSGLSYLALREAFRRRVWVALVLFLVVLMFAGWNLAPRTDNPALIYLNFVLTAATFIMVPVAIFAAAFSIPLDIKNRTIYTITTKPVRPSEIVLGRIIGFTVVTTTLLGVMGICSYIFVVRGLDHTHDLQVIETLKLREVVRYEGTTSEVDRHDHSVSIDANEFFPEIELAADTDAGIAISKITPEVAQQGVQEGDLIEAIDNIDVGPESMGETLRLLQGKPGSNVRLSLIRGDDRINIELPRTITETFTDTTRGHKHRVVARWSEETDEISCDVGPPEGMFLARVPKYGKLTFRDNQGQPSKKGVSVGEVYSYRSYIRGNTLAAAVWKFDGLTPENYPDGFDLDLNIRIYRTQLGRVGEGVAGSIYLRNPETKKRTQERIFSGKEFTIDQMHMPRKVWDTQDRLVDLFEDGIVSDKGEVEVWISCIDPGQYFGMAQADAYIRAHDASYGLNFIKGYIGIWLQIVLVTALAVLFSTFLSGPVAMLLSFATVILGFKKDFLLRLAEHKLDPTAAAARAIDEKIYGGGPLESFYRVITQRNLTRELDDSMFKSVIQEIDYYLMYSVDKLLNLLPDFEQFVEVQYLSHGYNINSNMLLQHVVSTLAFLFAAYVIGYFVLKSRELAR